MSQKSVSGSRLCWEALWLKVLEAKDLMKGSMARRSCDVLYSFQDQRSPDFTLAFADLWRDLPDHGPGAGYGCALRFYGDKSR